MAIDHMARSEPGDGAQPAAIDGRLSLLDGGRTWLKPRGADGLSRTAAPFRDALPIAHRLGDHALARAL